MRKRKGYLPRKAKTEDWCTPPEIVKAVRRVFGGRIDLDPCSNPWSIVEAKCEVMPPRWNSGTPDWAGDRERRRRTTVFGDGLSDVAWSGNVYVNSPYGALLADFMGQARGAAVDHSNAHVIMLAPCKTSRKCWQEEVSHARAVCFIDGRVTYVVPDGPETSATFSSALILWTRNRELVHRFVLELDGKLGHVMVPA